MAYSNHSSYVSKQLQRSLEWFVMGYFIEHIGSMLLVWKLHKQKSIYGISINAQVCLFLATLARCVWFTDTKLPTMISAKFELGLALALHAYILLLCYRYKDSLYREQSILQQWYVLLPVAAVLACIFHPGSKSDKYFFTQQMFVSFTMFAEALSLTAQLAHMQASLAVEGLTTSYLALLGLSRFSRIFFWYSMSSKLKQFWYLILADALHSLGTCGFAYKYRLIQRSYGGESVLAFSGRSKDS